MNIKAYEKMFINNFSSRIWYINVPKKCQSSSFSGTPTYPKNLLVLGIYISQARSRIQVRGIMI